LQDKVCFIADDNPKTIPVTHFQKNLYVSKNMKQQPYIAFLKLLHVLKARSWCLMNYYQ
jgi:hypothetical protein